jgi:hypothetical protein
MQVLTGFDAAVAAPCEIAAGEVTFDLRPGQRIIHVQLVGAPTGLTVHLAVDEKGAQFVEAQGLYVSRDRLTYEVAPLERTGDERVSAKLEEGGELWISNRLPYGRDGLDRLLAETGGAPGLGVEVLAAAGRSLPVFEFGAAGTTGPVHWIVAGEDCWETAGTWVADYLVRELASGSELARRVLSRATVKVVPLASPYSAARDRASYVSPQGEGLYGAATWGDELPPPEYRLIREAVVADARAGRLGLLLTIHSWQGAHDHSGMEFVRTAGDNQVEGERLAWAKATLDALVANVPKARGHVSEKIWHPGLARDYMLAAHGAITYRIEITTVGQSYQGFRESARGLLSGASAVEDWTPALP